MLRIHRTNHTKDTDPPCCKSVKPENAARSFTNPAPILRNQRVLQVLEKHIRGRVLELGAGCLRNALHLQKLGYRVFVLEVPGMKPRFPAQYKMFESRNGRVLAEFPKEIKFHVALATFVIETICDPKVRTSLLRATRHHLTPDGSLILSVRGPSDVVTATAKGKRCSDGYFTPNQTFSRAYTRAELQRFLTSCGFRQLEFLHKPSTKQPELLHVLAWR